MCGIAGYVGDFLPGLAAGMNIAQNHRGPDGNGTYECAEEECALGHVRLAILDLSEQAAQPMQSRCGRYVLVYNGELYNFRELRAKLEQHGCTFQSSGDTEVLLQGLIQSGEAFVEQLNGIFAFALWDRYEKQLLLARDPLGVKPLYLAHPNSGTILFASEIKALLAHPALPREPDFVALHQHLAYCYSSGERTALKSVRRLLPGTVLRWNSLDRETRSRKFFVFEFADQADSSRSEGADRLRIELENAVQRQLVSDVPVGSFLSGGLDSSLITAFAVKHGQRLACYTTSCSAQDNTLDQFIDDLPFARQMADRLGVVLHEIQLRSSMTSMWPHLVYHLDEPIADPAAIACYLISRMAKRQGSTVLLSGQGADELLAGYLRYWLAQPGCLDMLPSLVQRLVARGVQTLPGAIPGPIGATLRRLRRVLSVAHHSREQRFLDYCTVTPESEIRRVLSSDFLNAIGQTPATAECMKSMCRSSAQDTHRFQERDLQVYLPNHNLLYTDKMSMAAGVETRVPFLDREFVRFANQLPANWKLSRRRTKAILRQAAKPVLPDSIIHRRKAGFAAPYRTWLRNELAETWNEISSQQTVQRRGWFDHRALHDARQRSDSGETDLYMLQWSVMTIELWARQFIDQVASVPLSSPTVVHTTDGNTPPRAA